MMKEKNQNNPKKQEKNKKHKGIFPKMERDEVDDIVDEVEELIKGKTQKGGSKKMNERRFGKPRTDEERKVKHKERYGTDELPPRGTGIKNVSSPKDEVEEIVDEVEDLVR